MCAQKIGWGLIGASTIARQWMIDAFKACEDSDVIAVYDIARDRAEQMARDWDGIRVMDSVEDLLADDSVTAVYISTTNETHAPLTLQAAAAGKHVLCEKPMAMDLADARTMIESCQRAGVVLAINHHLRNAATHRAICQAIRDGKIGKPVAARVFHAVYLPANLQTWRINNPAAGGGAILDITVHNADTIRYLFDEEPVDVVAMSQSVGMGESGLEDGAMSVTRFPSGLIVQMHEGFTIPHGGTGLEVHGTEGSLFAKDVMTQQPIGSVTLRTENGETEIPVEHENLYEVGVKAFADAVRGKGNPAAGPRDGFASLAFALAVMKAAETGTRVGIAKL